MKLFEELQWRGLVYQASEGLPQVLDKEQVTAYIGFDPTAASLHVGSLIQIIMLTHMQRHGHSPIAIAGGGTGMIGDPSGKSQERQLLSMEKIDENVQGIKAQLSKFLDFDAKINPARLVNNADWLATIPTVTFMRDVGKYFTVNYMLAKDSVKRRIDQEQGISFTEFSYMLLQAYDFLILFDRYHCTLQIGGSDQWGNITAGIDLIRSQRNAQAHGLVVPLLTNPSGTKFGKSESGTVWLDPRLTSPYRFYQFWFNTDDRDVVAYLKWFTFFSPMEIDELANAVTAAPEKRRAQRTLAQNLTRLAHGETALAKAERASQVLFGAEISELSVADVLDIFADVPSSEIAKEKIDGMGLLDLLASTGLASSKSDARRLIQSGGIYINNRRVSDVNQTIALSQTIDGRLLILRKGAKQYHVVKILE